MTGDDNRDNQSDAAARRRQRPGAEADRGTPAGHQGAVPAARGAACARRARWSDCRRRRGSGSHPCSRVAHRDADDDRIKLEPSWKAARRRLAAARRHAGAVARSCASARHAGARIFPPGPQIFAAFDATPFDAVKVVILGQDPYHGAGPGARPVLLGAAGRAGAAVAGQHLQGNPARPRHRAPGPWLPAAVGAAGRAAAQLGADGRGRPRRRAPGQGLGRLHRPRRRDARPRARRPGVPALGQLRAGQGQGDRPAPPSRAARARIPRRCRRIAASSAAGISPRPTITSSRNGKAPIDWSLPPRAELQSP